MTRIRSTQAWRRLAKQTCQEEPTCWLQLPGCTTLSTTADHIHPVTLRPDLALVRTNTRGACASCNHRRGNTPISMLDELRCALTQYARQHETRHVVAQHDSPQALGFFRAN